MRRHWSFKNLFCIVWYKKIKKIYRKNATFSFNYAVKTCFKTQILETYVSLYMGEQQLLIFTQNFWKRKGNFLTKFLFQPRRFQTSFSRQWEKKFRKFFKKLSRPIKPSNDTTPDPLKFFVEVSKISLTTKAPAKAESSCLKCFWNCTHAKKTMRNFQNVKTRLIWDLSSRWSFLYQKYWEKICWKGDHSKISSETFISSP